MKTRSQPAAVNASAWASGPRSGVDTTVLPRIKGCHLCLSKIGDRQRTMTDVGTQHVRELVDPSCEPRTLFGRGRKRGLELGLDTFLLQRLRLPVLCCPGA